MSSLIQKIVEQRPCFGLYDSIVIVLGAKTKKRKTALPRDLQALPHRRVIARRVK
jgi:hypothetical protein